MLRLLGDPKRVNHRVTRRDLLHVGGLGLLGIGLEHALASPSAQAAANNDSKSFGRAKSCILIYKYGSPPQHETFDPKPQAPAEIQGEFRRNCEQRNRACDEGREVQQAAALQPR